MADRNGYIGRAPSDSSVVVARQTFEPTGITTTFTFASGYTIGYLDVYINGVRLIEGRDYNATNGSTVDLDSAATNGDVLELVAYKAFNVATVDTAPGNLSVGNNLTVDGYISAGGTVTGSAFYGDGSNLTGIVAGATLSASSGSQRLVVTSLTSGTMTSAGTDVDLAWDSTTNTLSATNVSIAGTLTYEDVTNVDSIGIVTARSGVRVDAGGLVVTSGVTTLTDNTFVGTGVSIYSATGIVSATAFYGDGANLTGLPAGGVEIQSAGSPLGVGITSINFQSGATVTASGAGSTITISAGIQTEASTGGLVTLDLTAAQDHKVTATGITTITVSGGTEGESHTVRIVNSGIATVGFSTYFLFPSGSPPSLPTASGTINLVSFTVHRVGTAGTQLLAGAGLNYQ